ncbi:ParA family protein [Geopsychrobacter electrodiphilus]|uniref:ParA family protein n=1 Tax=Geopsychrobacter electrodiphilus TaxID=225196 RepID=UPI00036A58D3|nr:ParA family protein [Geopsychrobacter electrodiphilus]
MARPYVITVSSEKGGVGKTTLATNLAIYLKALAKDLQVTLLSFDNHFTVDRMFRLSHEQADYHVGHLFKGISPTDLIVQGEYGVQIIPSCSNLNYFNAEAPVDESLAGILSQSELGGILIIDTCPILDPYTRNALFAADRVIVPVKDAPSLENCQHLARFYSDHGIKHSPLRLLPCLLDTRIRYKGPFGNSYQLLKAYAINRGYRCFEGFIAKSPKVESLGTNPEGKVYPILTHGRATEVHLQFRHLARQAYLEYLEKGPHRINEILAVHESRSELHDQRERQRRQRLFTKCLCCDRSFESQELPAAFYIESSARDICGFIEEHCFYEMIFGNLYGSQKAEVSVAVKEIFEETAQRSYFLMQRPEPTRISLARLDPQGETLFQRVSDIKSTRSFMRRGTPLLHHLLDLALPINNPKRMLLIKYCAAPAHEILQETAYARFQTVFSRARLDFETPENSEDEIYCNPVFP